MYPDVAYNSQDDEYLVVFEWPDASGSGRDIASIRVDASGQAAYSPNGVAIDPAYTDTHPAVAYNPTNNTYFVAWERSDPATATGKDIVRVILNASGAVSGTDYIVVNWDGDQRFPDVAYSAVYDRYLVVWEDHYPGLVDGPDIYGGSFDGSGSDRKYVSVTELNAAGEQSSPAVAANAANGRWLVTWRDSRNSGTTGYDIYGQQVFSDTSPLWGSPIAVGVIPGSAADPDVAWGQVGPGDGAFLTVWLEPYDAMVGQRVLADGTLTGDVITVSNYASDKSVPAVAFDATDKAWWVVWEDNRDYG